MKLRICACGNAVKHGDRSCNRCGRGKRVAKASTHDAGYGWDWQQLSMRYRAEHPLCEMCYRDGMATSAAEVHHIVSINDAPWLRMAVSNLMSLCVPCHRRIDQERREGGRDGVSI